MTRGKHRPPSRLTLARVAIADGAVLAFGLTFAVATAAAPHAVAPHTAAAPTAVELPREPTGHGGPIAYPTFPTKVWAPTDGPVVANGQKLPAVTVTAAPELSTSFPNPATVAPTQAAATTSAPPTPVGLPPVTEPAPTPEPQPDPVVPIPTGDPEPVPVVVVPVEPDPVVTPPAETPTEPTPTEPTAEPTPTTEPVTP